MLNITLEEAAKIAETIFNATKYKHKVAIFTNGLTITPLNYARGFHEVAKLASLAESFDGYAYVFNVDGQVYGRIE